MPEPAAAAARYVHTRVRLPPPGVDAVATGAALVAGDPGPYVLYERPDEVCVASGALVELRLDRDGIEVRRGAERTRSPLTDRPLARVGELLARTGVEGWRAHGWMAFELSHLLLGDPASCGSGTLLHLVVPEREVRMRDDTAELRSVRAGDLDELAGRLVAAVPDDDGGDPAGTGRRTAVDEDAGGARYRRAVAAAVDDIRDTPLRKVILSRTVPVPGEVDLVATDRAGRRGNSPARSFLFDLGGLRAAGFSPETVVEVAADGRVSTQPLAGTRELTGDRARDRRLRQELLADPKEIFEHAVSVQVAQDEIGALCRPGTVRVEGFMQITERGSVQHLASRVAGVLADGTTAWDAVAGLFPAVTASGLPKAEACAAIRRHETTARGLYSGAVVQVDADGALDAALVLRTVFEQDGRAWLRAGAGVVEQSLPERELTETREKLRSVSRFLVPARVAAGVPR